MKLLSSDRLRWPGAWAWPAFRWRLLLVLGLLLGLALVLPRFFAFIQARPGHLLPDPLLDRLPAHDTSALTFGLIYLGLLVSVVRVVPRPLILLRLLWAYLLLHACRMLTLWLIPLEPPTALLMLHDPLVDRLFYASPAPITKDLFFSGHTATLTLLALAVPDRWLRRSLTLATVGVAALVLVQHVHYTYDVVAAPLFAWFCYWLAGRIVLSIE